MENAKEINVTGACAALARAQASGGGLLVLTGAGMSVSSGVPVFRASDGTMSPDFLRFLGDYNTARKSAGLDEADDWFSFSVPEMFKSETAKQAWAYWRWRILRAKVTPGEDYQQLSRLIDFFGAERVFVQTSNCDGLHTSAGVSSEAIYEIHGSLSRVQCSEQCCNEMWPVDDSFVDTLRQNPEYVPMCPKCTEACLRPNVMIFGDYALVSDELANQKKRLDEFKARFRASSEQQSKDLNLVVLEVGAGTVVSSIRSLAESAAAQGQGLVRVNPSEAECAEMESFHGESLLRGGKTAGEGAAGGDEAPRYWPLAMRSNEALSALCDGLKLNPLESVASTAGVALETGPRSQAAESMAEESGAPELPKSSQASS